MQLVFVSNDHAFNILPRGIRESKGCKTDIFKNALDAFIHDEPQIPVSNSIRHMTTSPLRERRPEPTNLSQMQAAEPGDFGGL